MTGNMTGISVSPKEGMNMNNSPADVARVGDRIDPFNRALRGCFRFLAPVLATAGICSAAQAQEFNCDTDTTVPTMYINQRDRTIK
ncbi:MAG: hypothetical protein OXH09_13450, partial [Gammaproteobacteria bacterium]|nr:hypothetical protein [Gammaproteobacteria bacterium]